MRRQQAQRRQASLARPGGPVEPAHRVGNRAEARLSQGRRHRQDGAVPCGKFRPEQGGRPPAASGCPANAHDAGGASHARASYRHLDDDSYTSGDQAWLIAPGINAGGGLFSNHAGSTRVNDGNLPSDVITAAYFAESDVFVHNMAGFRAVTIASDLNEIRNDGNTHGLGEHGILAFAASNHVSITNSGSITGRLSGIAISSGSALVVDITNTGTISSDEKGVWLLNATGARPVITNSGTVKGARIPSWPRTATG